MRLREKLVTFLTFFAILFAFVSVAHSHESFSSRQITQEKTIEQTVKTVVRVFSENRGGSGVVISSKEGNTLVITNQHIVRNAIEAQIEIDGESYDGIVTRRDAEKDLALILIVGFEAEYVADMHPHPLRMLDMVIGVGATYNFNPFPVLGNIANPIPDEDGDFQLSMPVGRGMSGGGVFMVHERHYVLIGIVKQIATSIAFGQMGFSSIRVRVDVNNIGFAIPMATVREFLSK